MEGQGGPPQTTTFSQILPVIEAIGSGGDGHMAAQGGGEHARNKRCCNCDCDCGQTLVNTFADIVSDKLHHVYEHIGVQQKQMERVETLLMSVINIRYPELKRKIQNAGVELAANDLDDDDQNDTPKKRRRIYSHDISNKINTTLEPLFEENWKISKERERELGQKLADEIHVELSEGITIVKSFWHRSRGNSKRLYTQLDDYRAGLELIMSFDPEKKQEALQRFKIESEDVIRSDISELEKLLDVARRSGSGRTAVKGKKTLRKLPDVPIKTLKGRASALCNHFYALVQAGGNMDVLGAMEEAEPSTQPDNMGAYNSQQPLIGGQYASPLSSMGQHMNTA